MKVLFRWVFVFLIITSCGKIRRGIDQPMIQPGQWRGIIFIQGQELPFNFKIGLDKESRMDIVLINGEEKIIIDDAFIKDDSLYIPLHIFDATIIASVSGHSINGWWQKNYLGDYKLRFSAEYGQDYRFSESPDATGVDISGTWEVYFKDRLDSTLAVGIFNQTASQVEGTFLTSTGDYRYLAGEIDGRILKLSAFDGEHAFLFSAELTDTGLLKGDFWSGKSWHQEWYARKNEAIELPDPYSMTYLKEGFDRVDFLLPDLEGRMVSLSDEKFTGKVVIVQIFGTWCPNCMDETRFLSNWYKEHKDDEVEIVALAFERRNDPVYAKERINRMKDRFGTDYNFLFAGIADKHHASEVLPMLNQVISFPTTIFIDKSGRIRRIHTGFSGPGTGKYYEEFVEEFNLFMDKLLSE